MTQIFFFIVGTLILMAHYARLNPTAVRKLFQNELHQWTRKYRSLLAKLSRLAPWTAHR